MQEMNSFVGIDVSKTRLDGHVLPAGTTFAFGNHEPGLQELITHLVTVIDDTRACLVVLEATGGLQERAAAILSAAGLAVAVVNPRQVRDFARATSSTATSAAPSAAARCGGSRTTCSRRCRGWVR